MSRCRHHLSCLFLVPAERLAGAAMSCPATASSWSRTAQGLCCCTYELQHCRKLHHTGTAGSLWKQRRGRLGQPPAAVSSGSRCCRKAAKGEGNRSPAWSWNHRVGSAFPERPLLGDSALVPGRLCSRRLARLASYLSVVQAFDVALHLNTAPELVSRVYNRPTFETLKKKAVLGITTDGQLQRLARQRKGHYSLLRQRIERERKMFVIAQKLQTRKDLLDKTERVKLKKETVNQPAIYKFQFRRKR